MKEKISFSASVQLPFIGREVELERLKSAWREARAGRSKFYVLTGESGVGKTRLAAELAAHIKGEAEILVGRCFEFGMTLPYRLFTEPLREYFKKARAAGTDIRPVAGARPAEVVDFIPELGMPGVDGGPAVNISDPGAKYRLFDAITQIVAAISRTKPVFFMLDDLQWADSLSRELLGYVVQNSAAEKILFCATWRPEGATMDLERTEKIALAGLGLDETKKFLTVAFATADVPDRFARDVYRQSGGNPFYLEEIVKALVESGRVRFEPDWTFSDLVADAIPATLTGIVRQRLEKIDPATRSVLSRAALIGPEFSYDVLLPITGADPTALERMLGRAIASLIIREEPALLETKYGFVHDLIRKVLRESIPPDELPRLHELIAQTLETMYRYRLDDVLGDLAFHYSRTPNRDKAVEYLKRAADYAFTHFANEDAIRFFTMARSAGADEREIASRLGEVYRATGDYDRAVENFERARALATGPDEEARMLLEQGETVVRQGRYADAIRCYEAGLAKVAERSAETKAPFAQGLAWVHYYQGRYDRARSLCLETLDHGDIGDRLRSQSYNILAMVDYATGDTEQALEHYRQALSIFERVGNMTAAAGVYNNLTAIALARGDFASVLDYQLKYRRTAEKTGNPFLLAISAYNLGEVHLLLNDPQPALDYLGQARSLAERIDDRMGAGWAREGLGRLHQLRSEFQTAEQHYLEARAIFRQLGSKSKEHSTLAFLAELYLDRENFAAAAPLIEQVLAFAESSNASLLKSQALLAQARLALSEPARGLDGQRLLEQAIELSAGDVMILAPALYQLGRFWLLKKNPAQARAALDRADAVVQSVAQTIPEPELRSKFLRRRDIETLRALRDQASPPRPASGPTQTRR